MLIIDICVCVHLFKHTFYLFNNVENLSTEQDEQEAIIADLEKSYDDQFEMSNAIESEPRKKPPPLPYQKDKGEVKKRRLPSFIIFGFSKCGTRAFIDFLSLHPNVLSAGPEIDFFNRHYEEGLEWYRKKMPASYRGQTQTHTEFI